MDDQTTKAREATDRRSITRRMRSKEGLALIIALAAGAMILLLMVMLPENEAVPPDVPGREETNLDVDAPSEVDDQPASATDAADNY